MSDLTGTAEASGCRMIVQTMKMVFELLTYLRFGWGGAWSCGASLWRTWAGPQSTPRCRTAGAPGCPLGASSTRPAPLVPSCWTVEAVEENLKLCFTAGGNKTRERIESPGGREETAELKREKIWPGAERQKRSSRINGFILFWFGSLRKGPEFNGFIKVRVNNSGVQMFPGPRKEGIQIASPDFHSEQKKNSVVVG